MKKESAQGFQEIVKQYELDKYPKDEYTQAVFKEFRKYGTKLNKIANYEDMEKRGISHQQDVKDLMAKKPKFQSHLASLRRALDLYATTHSPQRETKAEAKPKDNALSRIAQLLVLGKVLQEGDKLTPDPLKNAEVDLVPIMGLFKQITSLKPGSETNIADEVTLTVDALKRLCEKSTEVLDIMGQKVSGAELAQNLAKAFKSSSTSKFKSELKVELAAQPVPATPPPGLILEPKKDIGVSTPRSLLEEAEVPPDPSKAMPVSFLVSETNQEERKKAKEEPQNESASSQQANEEENEFAFSREEQPKRYYGGGRYSSRRRGGYVRRPRSRGYTYVKREAY